MSEGRAPQPLPSVQGLGPSTEPSTELQDLASQDTSGAKGKEQSPVAVLASFSSPDEAVAGTSFAPTQDDHRVHQELLKRIAQDLGIQVEDISEASHSLVDILAPSGQSRVALPLNSFILELIKALWQTPASLQPMTKRVERKYFVPPKRGLNICTPILPQGC